MSNAVYTIQAKVGYSQVRSDNFLTLYSALNYMQDCAMTQLEYLGGGEEYFKNHGVALFISSMQVDIYEMPIFNQDILIDTWAYSYDKISCYRNYLIRNKDNKIYCSGSVAGIFVSLNDNKPVAITDEFMSVYPLKEKFNMEYLPRKIKLPTDWDNEGRPLVINKRHLDKNNHVNNSRYISLAEEMILDDYDIKKLRIEYKKPAKVGDTIIPKIKYTEKGCITALTNIDTSVFATVEFYFN